MKSSDTATFLRHVGHWSDSVLIDRSGDLYSVIELEGFEAELAGVAALVDAHVQDNALVRGVADPRLEWWDHYCVLDGQDMPPLPAIEDNWFADRFDKGYRAAQGAGSFLRYRMFVTLVWHPGDGLARMGRALFGGRDSSFPRAGGRDVAQFREVVGRVLGGLQRRYGAQVLGVRDGLFSGPAEAWHVALMNRERPIGCARGAIGPCLVPERVTVGHPGMRVPAGVIEIGERGRTYCSILSFVQPPARTRPTMLSELRGLRLPMTITNSALMYRRSESVRSLEAQQRHMKAAEDPSVEGRAALGVEAEAIQNAKSAQVSHHFAVTLFAPDVETLDERVSRALGVLSDAGITAVRETDALKAAFYAQLPGNARWRPRPAPMKSKNMLAFCPKHATPKGEEVGHWGAPIMYLRSLHGTAIPFHWHCRPSPQIPAGDLGNTMFFGRSGSGKTAMLGSLALLTLRVPRARVLIIDRDYGLSSMVRAAGFPYLDLRADEASGMVPLKRLSDSPADVGFLRMFMDALILSDGRGQIDSDEQGWLAEGVAREMGKPRHMRSIANIGALLGMRARHGAAARLRRWCRGEELGWAFDGEDDFLDTSSRMLGVNTNAVLNNPLLAGPSCAYLFHLANAMTTGNPMLIVGDELWAADQVESFQVRNNDWLKTGRKKGDGGVVMALATQSAHDALKSKIAHSYKQQVPRRVWFGEAGADREELMGGFGLSEASFDAITQTLPNEPYSCLIQEPQGCYIAKNDLSAAPGLVSVISGRDTTYALAERLRGERGADPEGWVPEYERLAPGLSTKRRLAVAAE